LFTHPTSLLTFSGRRIDHMLKEEVIVQTLFSRVTLKTIPFSSLLNYRTQWSQMQISRMSRSTNLLSATLVLVPFCINQVFIKIAGYFIYIPMIQGLF
jgi:hypothetical protein